MQFLSVVCDLHPISPPPLPLQTTPNKETCAVKQQYLSKIPDHAKQTNLCSKATVFVKNLFMFEYIFKEIYQFFFLLQK